MTPFAILKDSSCSPDNKDEEKEVLFTIGAIFKVQSIEHYGNIWYVHLQLNKEQNEISRNFSDHMMKQIGSEPDSLLFGWFLFRMAKFDEFERYAKKILKQLP
ncbi:unnamed protein product [Rotaria sp. Silwood2]|nr:unnamed protein product [Rotaria sp. Silwood2]CAF3189440.1 unnamed protein product [Rotaria sp. Silwood2]CAF3296732.1 unnamed protein product [Rotaria sp. Silwood2]CAF4100996.1 unnamed protein product [Rotaria sp. Silwood2]CAF4113946.1 unnamed protein product [Rotaria sp. Silwood2]